MEEYGGVWSIHTHSTPPPTPPPPVSSDTSGQEKILSPPNSLRLGPPWSWPPWPWLPGLGSL
jgi:hypothetical protein